MDQKPEDRYKPATWSIIWNDHYPNNLRNQSTGYWTRTCKVKALWTFLHLTTSATSRQQLEYIRTFRYFTMDRNFNFFTSLSLIYLIYIREQKNTPTGLLLQINGSSKDGYRRSLFKIFETHFETFETCAKNKKHFHDRL